MAIDQRDITSQLRMMDDRALQQYAAMHKSDPYIFPLAFQESQNRQKVRMNSQARMAGQEQPKVADAALMAMTPEEQGIGRLPAPNIQHMADGGIAGYGDDEQGMATGGMGGMFNFAQQSEPVVRMAAGGPIKMSAGGDVDAARARRRAAQDALYKFGLKQRRDDPEGFQAAQQELNSAEAELKAAEAAYAAEASGSGLNRPATSRKDVGAATTAALAEKYPPSQATLAKNYPGVTPGFEQMPAEASDVPSAKTNTQPSAANKPAPAAPAKPAAPAVEAAPAAPALPAYTAKTPEEIRKTADLMAKPELEEIQNAYKPYAEQFGQERTRLAAREKGNLGDALMRAGLGMMAGKSQFAMQNIGEGGLQGLNAYQEATRADDAARKALMQSEMQMAAAQRAERQGARKDAVSLAHQAEQSQQVATQLGQKSQEIKNTEAYQQGVLEHYKRADAAAMLSAQNRGAGAGANENKLILNALVKERDDIAKQLDPKANPFIHLSKNAAEKARLVARRNQLNAAIAGMTPEGTIPAGQMPAGSPTGSGGGDRVIDFTKI